MDRRLYTYAYVERPFDEVAYLLAEEPARVLQPATETAVARGDDVVARLAISIGKIEVGQDVRVHVGQFEPRGVKEVTLPIRWEATDGRALFPTMDAELELMAVSLDPPLTQVTLSGNYRPPLGAVGAVADSVLGHHVAEAAVHRFVKEICDRVEVVLEGREATASAAIGGVPRRPANGDVPNNEPSAGGPPTV